MRILTQVWATRVHSVSHNSPLWEIGKHRRRTGQRSLVGIQPEGKYVNNLWAKNTDCNVYYTYPSHHKDTAISKMEGTEGNPGTGGDASREYAKQSWIYEYTKQQMQAHCICQLKKYITHNYCTHSVTPCDYLILSTHNILYTPIREIIATGQNPL